VPPNEMPPTLRSTPAGVAWVLIALLVPACSPGLTRPDGDRTPGLPALRDALALRARSASGLERKLDAVIAAIDAAVSGGRAEEIAVENIARIRKLASEHTGRDETSGELTRCGRKAAAMLARLMLSEDLAGLPEWKKLLKGLSSKNAAARVEAFKAAARGDVLDRSLLRCALLGAASTAPHSVKLSRNYLSPGEEATYRYELRPDGFGIWVEGWLSSKLQVGTRVPRTGCVLRLKPDARLGLSEGGTGVSGGGAGRFGYRTVDPIAKFRLYLPGDPALIDEGKVRAKREGELVLSGPASGEATVVGLGPDSRTDAGGEAWRIKVGRWKIGAMRVAAVPVIPPAREMGIAVGGLRLKGRVSDKSGTLVASGVTVVIWKASMPLLELEEEPREPRPVPANVTSLAATIVPADDVKHIVVDGRFGWEFLRAVIFDSGGKYVKTYGLSNVGSKPGRRIIDVDRPVLPLVALQKGKLERAETVISFTYPGPPGRYMALLIYGPFDHDKDNPPPKAYWSGQLVSDWVEFSVPEPTE